VIDTRYEPHIRFLTPEEVNTLLASAKSERDYVLLRTLLYAGLRAQEVAYLRYIDINPYEKTISVVGKGHKFRTVYVDAETISHIERYVRNNKIHPESPLFKITTNVQVWRIVRDTAKRAGIKKRVTPHVLRHTFAIMTLRKTKNIKFLQQQLGHASLDTTQVYLKYASFEEERKLIQGGLYS